MKEVIISVLKKALKEKGVELKEEEIEKFIEIPPSPEIGDYAFPCFFLSRELKQEPHQIALEIREKIGNIPLDFEDIQTVGAYVNFFVDRKILARNLVKEILTKKDNFGSSYIGKGQKIVVEFSSPNIAKPFGIGQLRSTIIGNSISKICEFQGFKVIKINYLGDWGTQFGKILLGYEKFGTQEKLDKDPVKHLFEVYVKISKNKKYDEKAREYFKKLEQGDKTLTNLWEYFRKVSLEDFKKIYQTLGISFDVYSGESIYNKEIKKVVKELQDKKKLKKSEGALVVGLKRFGLGVCLIEKSDGSTLYATRDLASAISRYKKYKFHKMIYEVGQEQKLYFKQLFKVLELIGYSWAKDCVHIDHGLYLDKNGKRFATRKGETVFMEDIINETIDLSKKEILKRELKISKKELEKRAHKVAIAAIFYGDLKNNRTNNMIFDIKRFVSFQGDTGPYLLYSYARAGSILKKAKVKTNKFEIAELGEKEIELIKKLSQFQEIVVGAYKNLNPAVIANYSYQLARIFNEFYHLCPVISSKQELFRLRLVEAFRQVLKNSLNLLGIETLERM